MTILTETRQRPEIKLRPQPGLVAGSADDASLVTVKGIASRVVLDPKKGTATKTYRRHFLVRLLYWIAFQSSFPYISNRAAIKAAEYRRRVAGLMRATERLRHWPDSTLPRAYGGSWADSNHPLPVP